MIFCLSQIHTGTVSILAWLEAHEDCGPVLLSTDVYESGTEAASVYHEHVRADHLFHDRLCRTQIVMAWVHRTVIPLRDPLAALISYQHRAKLSGAFERDTRGALHRSDFKPLEDVVDRWVCLAKADEQFRDFPHIQYLPWDIFATKENRDVRLLKIAERLGLEDRMPSRTGLPERNSMGMYPMKDAYRRGDLEGLQALVGLDQLKDSESIVRPFLERHGYCDLLWWS